MEKASTRWVQTLLDFYDNYGVFTQYTLCPDSVLSIHVLSFRFNNCFDILFHTCSKLLREAYVNEYPNVAPAHNVNKEQLHTSLQPPSSRRSQFALSYHIAPKQRAKYRSTTREQRTSLRRYFCRISELEHRVLALTTTVASQLLGGWM